jgi:predicted transcriptional regulator
MALPGDVADPGDLGGLPVDPAVPQEPGTPATPVEVPVGNPLDPKNPGTPNDPGSPGADPGFGDRIRGAFHDGVVLASLATIGLAGLGIAGFAFVTRYITPKEALKNPQRAMLYGFIKGNPGVHLKKLSEEFHMKTSSILWHIRKLESAELVRSERANGFRVFYPTEGGLAVKQVGRAVTALQNPNARALFETVQGKMGQSAAVLAGSLQLHVGTARWHLKKLVEFGLLDELPGADGTLYVATPLGTRALQSLNGTHLQAPPPTAIPA